MKILSVKIVNILSIEEAYVEFKDSGLTLVQGWNHDVGRANGAGKTAIFNALTFALYDKLPRKITATEVLRRGCRSGYAEVLLEVRGIQYTVHRSRPKGVLFFKSGQPEELTQERFENIIQLNYEQFILSMYAAQGSTKRFLSVNDTDKKQFLLQLLNLEEFGACKSFADEKVKELSSSLEKEEYKINFANSKIEAYKESLRDESEITCLIQEADDSIVSIKSQLVTAKSVLKPDLSKYQKLEDDIASKRTEFTKNKARRELLHEQYRKTKAKITPFDVQTSCSECGSTLDTSAAKTQHDKLLHTYEIELSKLKEQIDVCDAALQSESSVNDLATRLYTKKRDESRDYDLANKQVNDLQRLLDSKLRELNELNLKLENNLELNSKIKVLSDTIEKSAIVRASIVRDIELYKTISALYSPTGAQAYILDSIIESFNERVVEYVNLLWSNLTYELKSYKENVKGDITAKFSESLTMDGKDISIGSLSGGEARALSLCVDFALIDVMEQKFSISMSPIILDEPFNDLDNAGRELIIELLGTISDKRQIVVVDHVSEAKSMFSDVIMVDKKSGISEVSLSS